MDKKKRLLGALVIASAIIWGAVILGCSVVLEGTGCYDKIQNVLIAGVITHLLFIWGPVIILFKNKRNS